MSVCIGDKMTVSYVPFLEQSVLVVPLLLISSLAEQAPGLSGREGGREDKKQMKQLYTKHDRLLIHHWPQVDFGGLYIYEITMTYFLISVN